MCVQVTAAHFAFPLTGFRLLFLHKCGFMIPDCMWQIYSHHFSVFPQTSSDVSCVPVSRDTDVSCVPVSRDTDVSCVPVSRDTDVMGGSSSLVDCQRRRSCHVLHVEVHHKPTEASTAILHYLCTMWYYYRLYSHVTVMLSISESADCLKLWEKACVCVKLQSASCSL